ncbi:hypothetical protein D3C87_1795700 [compost metagenome]
MVDAHQIAHRLGQIEVERDPLANEDLLCTRQLIPLLQLPDPLVQRRVAGPVCLHALEDTALLHVFRPDGGVMIDQLLGNLGELAGGLAAVLRFFLRI